MPKRNCAWDSCIRPRSTVHHPRCWLRWTVGCRRWTAFALLTAGCATPQYALRPTPVPEESAEAIRIERAISAAQAKEFEEQDARRIDPWERPGGLAVQQIVDRLSRVTERPSLDYRAYRYEDRDPNAAALADGRIYLSSGMLEYLASRGSREAELAFIVAHELAHTVAQHLVKRYRMLQQQQLLMALVAAGAAAATRDAGAAAQQAGQLALDTASLLQDVHNSGYSQEQELEADQLGIRYVIRAGYDPQAALELLADFARFDTPWPFLRTHPYILERRAYLQRYLLERGALAAPEREEQLKVLRETQRLYPEGSVSWTNLQRQIEALERQRD